MWMTLIIILITFYMQKKSGKSNGKAALTAAAAGLGSYYVTTQTDWGKASLGALDDKISQVFNPDGTAAKDGNGNDVYESEGKPVPRGPDGKVQVAPDGGVLNNIVDGAAGVLKSWGGAGTAAVIGTTAAVSTSDNKKLFLYAALAIGAILLLK